jgi:hypothetical protein
MQYHCDKFVKLSSEAKDAKDDDMTLYYQKIAEQYHYFIYSSLLLTLGLVSLKFISILRRLQYDDWQSHKCMIFRYICFMLASLIIKFYLGTQLTDYTNESNLNLYSLSELIALTLFVVFKVNEDCFQCFNRCVNIDRYSVFQFKRKREDWLRFESESDSQDNAKALIDQNINRTIRPAEGRNTISERSKEDES